MPTDRTHPLTELRLLLRGSVNLARRARNYLEQLGWESAEEVAEEVVKHERKIAADAYSAQQSDLQAAKLLEDAARDGLTSADMPAVAEAIRHIRRSAEKDRQISEAAAI